jgi:hypothetical protein
VIIYAYQHVRLLPPESLVVNQSVLRSGEPTLLCNQVLWPLPLETVKIAFRNANQTLDI